MIRIGTCGILQPEVPVHSYILSTHAFGLDNVAHYYDIPFDEEEKELNKAINDAVPLPEAINTYLAKASESVTDKLRSDQTVEGITITSSGFYGPQGRVLRLPLQDPDLNKKIDSFNYNNNRITNLEMETSAIYGLAKLLGHNAASMNAIIANRANGTFSKDPYKVVNDLIAYTLDKLVE